MYFLLSHGHGNGFELDGEGAAEAAAGGVLGHFDALQAGYAIQQQARAGADAALAQGRAGVVVGVFARQPGPRNGGSVSR